METTNRAGRSALPHRFDISLDKTSQKSGIEHWTEKLARKRERKGLPDEFPPPLKIRRPYESSILRDSPELEIQLRPHHGTKAP